MKIDELIRAATSHAESVKVSRTGINPLLWLVGLITPLALVLSAWTNDATLRIAFLAFAALRGDCRLVCVIVSAAADA